MVLDFFMLYFPLAEERNKWKMFSHTPLGPEPEGLFFESHAQCLLVAVLLSAIADVYFELDSFSKFSSPLPLLFVVRYDEC